MYTYRANSSPEINNLIPAFRQSYDIALLTNTWLTFGLVAQSWEEEPCWSRQYLAKWKQSAGKRKLLLSQTFTITYKMLQHHHIRGGSKDSRV